MKVRLCSKARDELTPNRVFAGEFNIQVQSPAPKSTQFDFPIANMNYL